MKPQILFNEIPNCLNYVEDKILILLYHDFSNTSESNGLDRSRLTLVCIIAFYACILYLVV